MELIYNTLILEENGTLSHLSVTIVYPTFIERVLNISTLFCTQEIEFID